MTYYPNNIDDSTSLPPGTGDDATSINALIAAVEAIEIELGIEPSGVYATVRTRLDILEARIGNQLAPAPNVSDPFFIGNGGVTISTGAGAPTESRVNGSLYLRIDGTTSTGVYTFQNGAWGAVGGGAISGAAGGDLDGYYPDPSVIALDGYPLSITPPTTGQVLLWDGSYWTPTTLSIGTFSAGRDLSGTDTDQTVIGIQTVPVSATLPTTGQSLFYNGTVWVPHSFTGNLYTCPSGVNVADAVYSTGPDTIDQANASSSSTIPVIGFVSSKPTSTSAIIQYSGEVSGFVGLVPGDTYYLSLTAGQVTNDVSSYITGEVVQKVGFAKDTTTLVVMVNRDFTVL
jgi:hypothetical protein